MAELMFRILGPLEVSTVDGAIRLGGRRQRAVLAILLLRANQVVPVERLVESVYNGDAPATAVGQVRDHVSHLRKLLAPNGDGGGPLETHAPGYLLRVAHDQLDALAFEREVETGSAALRSGDAAAASARLRAALALWRGPPLADFAYESFARPEIERLEELRLTALGERGEAELALGRHSQLVPELEALVAANPLHGQFRRQLMIALYRSGRQAEAVQSFHEARKSLADELGIEASAELRALVSRMLRQDPTLDPEGMPSSDGPTARAVTNPYKGLRAFEESDAEDFFGREALTQRLAERLQDSRLLVVVGPSGSGKSSVVRAGLVPAMRNRVLHVVVLTPGTHPLEELEAALLRVAVNPPASLLPQLAEDERGLVRALKRVLPEGDSELLVVIDQFEELFTLVDDEQRRAGFLALLERALTDPLSRVRVVATLRADFYDRPLQYREFAELLRDSVDIVPPLGPDELERAIAAPARRAGLRLEEGLLAEIVAEVLEQPGGLPLLQYALTELFERRDGSALTRAAYAETGGVSAALARRAESVYAGLGDLGRDAARQLFLRLVTVGDGSDTRRRADRRELASLDVDQVALETAIDAFGSSRLLSFDRDPRTQESTVEIAHEALLEHWDRLRDWIELVREDIAVRRRIASAAVEWHDSGRDQSFLLRGLQLARAEAAGSRSDLAQTDLERDYLTTSVKQRSREEAAARRSLKRLRGLAAALLAASIVAAALAFFAFDQSASSKRQAAIATARQLAAASAANLEVDPDRSILLALRAVETSPDGQALPEAVDALHRAIEASRIVLTVQHAGKQAVSFSPDGSRVVTAGPDVRVWGARSGRQLLVLSSQQPAHDVAYSPDGREIATGGDGGNATIWNATNGSRVAVLPEVGDDVSVSFSPDGKELAADSYAGTLRVWRLSDRHLVRTFRSPHPLCGVAWSADGRRVGAGDCGTNYATASGRVWEVRTGRLVRVSAPQYGAALTLAFSPDGRDVATPNLDGTAQVWDLRSGRLRSTFRGHTGRVYALAYSPRGNLIATGATDGTARVWSPATGVTQFVLAGHTGIVDDVAFDATGRRLATVSADGSLRVWDVSATGSRDWMTIAAHPGGVDSLYYADDGRRLLTAGRNDARTKVWNTQTGALLASYKSVHDIAFRFTPVDRVYFAIEETSPDSSVAASARSNGTIQLRDAGSGSVRRVLPSRGVDVARLAFSSDGSEIAAGYFDGRVVVWDVATGGRVRTVSAQSGLVEGVAFSHDGRYIATAGEDGTARLWDLRSGRDLVTFGGRSFALTDVAFSPDGSRLATAGGDGVVRIYVLPVPELVAVARQRLTRGWTPDECARFLPGKRCPSSP